MNNSQNNPPAAQLAQLLQLANRERLLQRQAEARLITDAVRKALKS